jgi:DNA polymerase-3 subunit alpha
MLSWEKETLGIFVSGHPLADVQPLLVRQGATPVKDLQRLPEEAAVTIAGMVTGVRRTLTKSGQQMLIAQLEDTTGACDVILFAKLYGQFQQHFVADAILIVKGRLRLRERPGTAPGEEPPVELSISANEVTPFVPPTRMTYAPAGAWHVEVSRRDQIDRLAALVDEWPGSVPVVMHAGGRAQLLARSIADDARVRGELDRIFGGTNVREGSVEDLAG